MDKLIQHIYDILDCKEEQTLPIIANCLKDIKLFDKKQHDYGSSNIAKFGTMGVLVRSSDKIERLINLSNKGKDLEAQNEAIEDSWQDLSVYGNIARVCLDGEWKD